MEHQGNQDESLDYTPTELEEGALGSSEEDASALGTSQDVPVEDVPSESVPSDTSSVSNQPDQPKGRSQSRMRSRVSRRLNQALNPFNTGIQKMKNMSENLIQFTNDRLNDDKWEDFDRSEDQGGVGTYTASSDFQMSPDGLTGEWKIEEDTGMTTFDSNAGIDQKSTGVRQRRGAKEGGSTDQKTDVVKLDEDGESYELGSEELMTDVQQNRDQVHNFIMKRKQDFFNKMAMWDNYSALYLVLVGVLTAAVGTSMDLGIFHLQQAHYKLMNTVDSITGQFFLWVGYYIVLFYFAITLTVYIAPQAAGSGVPELKSIMTGIHLKRVLSFRVLLVKMFGLTAALGSGAFLGKEGPFIHLSATLATQLARLPLFQRIRRSEHLMQIMLGAACATGVASHFGSPVGGVLFSIEVTTAYYPTRNYWTAYIGAVTGGTCFRYIWNSAFRKVGPSFRPLVPTGYSNDVGFGIVEIFVFMLLGVATGLLGVGFIKLYSLIARTWKKICLRYNYIRSPYAYALFVAILTGCVTFPDWIGNFISLAPLKGLSDLVSEKELTNQTLNAKDWGNRNIYLNLFIFMASRYIITPLSIIMPVPCGLFVPILTIGASVGRIFGEAAYQLLEETWLYEHADGQKYIIYAGSYAIAGAAAFTTSVTQTLSAAVIVFEITGSIVHLIPVLVTVLVSMGVSKRFRMGSIYDCISVLKGLPFLPDLKKETYALKAAEIMDKNTHFITKEFEVEGIRAKLKETNLTMFPIVNSAGKFGTIRHFSEPRY
eukprot:TRINITY_DN8592_c0_g1_i2.p1 TRINITY_DN8592_c0_g1~~TRINITY_DN8592_c0_g1_i2.p1  ORF type:complete len:768 (-),score=174.80 TRINITY_DN8592_c0_g1_i2:384-2687(-)